MRGELVPSFRLNRSELLERDTNRRVFLRGVNIQAKMPPFQHYLTDANLTRLHSFGLTAIRLSIAWEALEPVEGSYDTNYMQYVLQTVRQCAAHGIAVIIDPHQDCWSRWTGGDGAPMWTLTRLGFDLKNLEACAAVLSDRSYPSIWATNYHLFAAATMFTLFFG